MYEKAIKQISTEMRLLTREHKKLLEGNVQLVNHINLMGNMIQDQAKIVATLVHGHNILIKKGLITNEDLENAIKENSTGESGGTEQAGSVESNSGNVETGLPNPTDNRIVSGEFRPRVSEESDNLPSDSEGT